MRAGEPTRRARTPAKRARTPRAPADASRRDAGPAPTDTPLADLAASLAGGTWAALETIDMDPTLTDTGSTGNMIPYADSAAWDPGSRQLLFMGADHITAARFVTYSDATNTWSIMADQPWFPDAFFHGYDHSVVRADAGEYFQRPFGSGTVHKYTIATGEWEELPDAGAESSNCCDGLAHFPELGGLVWPHGHELFVYGDETGEWTRLPAVIEMEATWNFAEYNPVHRVVLLGSAGARLWRLSDTGEVTPLRDPPISMYDGSGHTAVVTVDPISGTYLVLTPTERDFYAYDIESDTWTELSSPTKPELEGHSVLGAQVSTYGINLFVTCRGTCRLYAYRHSD
jgi:hypothetical protein